MGKGSDHALPAAGNEKALRYALMLTGGFMLAPRTIVRRDALKSSGLLEPGSLFDSAYRMVLPKDADLTALQAKAEARAGVAIGPVDTIGELENTKARLEAHGIEVLGVTDHHIFKSIYFFDPNGIRLELTAQLADEFQMLQESKTAHARLGEWNARKEQWRKERAAGKSAAPLKPQQNDRPEVAERAKG